MEAAISARGGSGGVALGAGLATLFGGNVTEARPGTGTTALEVCCSMTCLRALPGRRAGAGAGRAACAMTMSGTAAAYTAWPLGGTLGRCCCCCCCCRCPRKRRGILSRLAFLGLPGHSLHK